MLNLAYYVRGKSGERTLSNEVSESAKGLTKIRGHRILPAGSTSDTHKYAFISVAKQHGTTEAHVRVDGGSPATEAL